MFSYDITKLTFSRALNLIVIIFTMFIMPLWYIFQFSYAHFEKTETLKLILIAPAFSIPVVLLNVGIFSMIAPYINNPTPDSEKKLVPYTIASYMAMAVFYLPGIGAYLKPLSLQMAIKASIITQASIYLAVCIIGYISTRNVKQASTTNARNSF